MWEDAEALQGTFASYTKLCVVVLKDTIQYIVAHLHHIQNSVFEGEITEAKLEALKIKAKKIMNEEDGDSLILFKSRNEKWLNKEIVGADKRPVDNIL